MSNPIGTQILKLTNPMGNQERYSMHDAFVIPKGLSGTWEMPQGMKKYFVVFGRGSNEYMVCSKLTTITDLSR